MSKPVIRLRDSSPLVILTQVQMAMRKVNANPKDIGEFRHKAINCTSYNDLLDVAAEYVEIK